MRLRLGGWSFEQRWVLRVVGRDVLVGPDAVYWRTAEVAVGPGSDDPVGGGPAPGRP